MTNNIGTVTISLEEYNKLKTEYSKKTSIHLKAKVELDEKIKTLNDGGVYLYLYDKGFKVEYFMSENEFIDKLIETNRQLKEECIRLAFENKELKDKQELKSKQEKKSIFNFLK